MKPQRGSSLPGAFPSHGSCFPSTWLSPPGGSFADLMYGDFFDRNEKPCRGGCDDGKEDDIERLVITIHK